MGAVYLFHDLYGYLMEMSPDIASMIESFDDGVDTEETITYYKGKFGDSDPQQFVDVLVAHSVLVDPKEDEIEGVWAYVPMHGKWNVWQRKGDRLTLWTAWGEQPVQQLNLDEDETKIWDAFDGNKRLIELRHHHDNDKIIGLVRKLTHSNVQALKMSMMPWSLYSKRPAMAPPYLTSTMPYARWQPGTAVPPAVSLSEYHKSSINDANAQFDHQETTLSHLLRVPHPVLDDRTYGQALGDVIVDKQLLSGRARILEIGAGLGYVARDLIARLRERGITVEYTIAELSPTLAKAQRERLSGDATWLEGDVLAARLPDASFDLILSNEMVGDLPATQLSREAIGLAVDGTGTVDRDKLRALGGGAAIAADLGVGLDDAPEPFYLMTGAFELIARIARWLAPGGSAIVTEFGELAQWPKVSTHLDHPELSTHFGQLLQAARGAGLEGSIEFVIDLLDFDRDEKGLVTTRSHFRALRALAEHNGVDLPKIGYTPKLLEAAIEGKLELETVGELRWDRVEDRLMGLVPHEFKALLVKRPR